MNRDSIGSRQLWKAGRQQCLAALIELDQPFFKLLCGLRTIPAEAYSTPIRLPHTEQHPEYLLGTLSTCRERRKLLQPDLIIYR